MLLVDQISSNMNDSANPAERNITATIGLVVHAAGTIQTVIKHHVIYFINKQLYILS